MLARRRGGGYSFISCLSHLASDHASPSRQDQPWEAHKHYIYSQPASHILTHRNVKKWGKKTDQTRSNETKPNAVKPTSTQKRREWRITKRRGERENNKNGKKGRHACGESGGGEGTSGVGGGVGRRRLLTWRRVPCTASTPGRRKLPGYRRHLPPAQLVSQSKKRRGGNRNQQQQEETKRRLTALFTHSELKKHTNFK